MRTRNLHPLVRLIASLLFGLAVLFFFVFVSVEMATHHFQRVAERAIRQGLGDDAATGDNARSDLVCRRSDGDEQAEAECDPAAITAGHSLRSASCNDRSVLHLLGRPWSCVARFTDGGSVAVRVSLGFRRHRIELLLPRVEPGS